jgi:hypothetical protein
MYIYIFGFKVFLVIWAFISIIFLAYGATTCVLPTLLLILVFMATLNTLRYLFTLFENGLHVTNLDVRFISSADQIADNFPKSLPGI